MPNSYAAQAEFSVSVADYTKAALMVPQVQGRDVTEVIKELSQVLYREACIPQMLPFYQAAMNREFLASTVMDHGLAFPHARLSGLTQLWFALGRSRQPIPWGTHGAQPVNLVFLVAVPATGATSYLHLLSGLARLGRENRWLESLRAAPTSEAIWAVLNGVSLRQGLEAGRPGPR